MQTDMKKIQSNWETYEKLAKRLGDDNIGELLDTLGERLVMCPASPKKSATCAFPGGLVEHSLDVTRVMRKIASSLELDIDISSILKVGLFHDIGKVGDLEKDYFIDQDSDWHREKLGQLYKFNDSLNKMSISHRTLYLLQHFRIGLTNDEWIAIQLAQGSHFEENRFYVGHEPTLAMVLQQAKQMTTHLGSMG